MFKYCVLTTTRTVLVIKICDLIIDKIIFFRMRSLDTSKIQDSKTGKFCREHKVIGKWKHKFNFPNKQKV